MKIPWKIQFEWFDENAEKLRALHPCVLPN